MSGEENIYSSLSEALKLIQTRTVDFSFGVGYIYYLSQNLPADFKAILRNLIITLRFKRNT